MRRADVIDLLLLAALWGASFLFMRIAAPHFGAAALSAVRVGGAALVLLPLVATHGLAPEMRRHWRAIGVVGLTSSALPFLLYGYASQAITAGLASIFNATAPLWAALIAWLWLGDRLGPLRSLGLAVGFAGVAWLGWDKASFRTGLDGVSTGWAVLACIAATFMYGLSANMTKRSLQRVNPLAVAAGSQVAATGFLLAPAWLWWPSTTPPALAWASVAALAVLCTGLAYILYFRLIRNVGPANAIAVTFLIPAFAVLWGALLLDEIPTPVMFGGCAVILLGTALATGMLKAPIERAT